MSMPLRLSRVLASSGVSAREVARLAGLSSEAHVGMIIRGSVESPTVSTIAAIARALGCTVGYLIAGEGEAPSDEQVRASVAAARARLDAAPAATGTEG